MSTLGDSTDLSARQQYAVVAVAGLAALAVGLLLAPTVAGVVADDSGDAQQAPDSAVMVLTVDSQINQPVAEAFEAELRAARENESIDAVVLEMDTPGGRPAASERMYSAVKQTSQEMPVLASVQGVSASGGYYAMLPTESIYVHPTSITGSIGLAASAPQPSPPVEGPSGPDKRGGNELEAWAEQDLLAEVFIESVMTDRGDRIELSRAEVSQADTYLGIEAVENGLADEIGSVEAAVADAADRAGLDEYQIVRRSTTTDQPEPPVFVRTNDGIVAVYDENPGYGDVEPVGAALIYEPALPQFETVQQFVESDTNVTAAGGEP